MSSATGNLGGPLKVWGGGFAILSVAALSAAYMFAGDVGLVLIVAGGLAIVALMVAGIFMWRARVASARDKLIGKGLAGTAGGVGKADRAAMVEATRREFEKGVRKFRDAGRNLYSTPWYLIVGEPGGGKTEAIRHSQVRFIPGLQDMLQGVGGTLNMNWWFTRDAIILDTAGRILVEDLEAGTGGEWDTFLAMLKTHRKDCPINGLLLIIPADTLMTDTPAEIDRKASKIAAKFETLQQELGVRFPVFVIITKCDLIGGFNEFFENLNDTQANQMMGWSNPQPLNEEFEPKAVDEHLEQVRQKLIRRRMRRLIEPLRGEDGSTRRMDQVDALYSLPDNIKVLSPRLKQYLETVFVAGTWSQKPLFLRGIYFSSSLQKGSPLDLDLAAALGISVKDLPREEERDDKRTFFLRDLFMEKVFAEKGLVTRVVNVDALQRKRKLVMLGGGIAATLLFLGLTWYQFQQLNHVLTAHVNFWANASKNYDTKAQEYKIVELSGKYNGAQEQEGGTIPELLERSKELVEPGRDVRIPAMFRMWAKLGEGINEQRVKGHQKLVEAMVVSPVVCAARAKMAAETEGDWESHPHEAKEALKELIRLEVAKATPPAEAGKGLNSLFRYVLKPEDYGHDYTKDRPRIEGVYKWTMTRAAGTGAVKGYPTAEGRGTPAAAHAVAIGVNRYMGYVANLAERGSEAKLGALRQLSDALAAHQNAEDDLFRFSVAEVPPDEPTYKRVAEQWRGKLAKLREKAAELDGAVARLTQQLNWNGTDDLGALYEGQIKSKLNSRQADLNELMACIPADAAEPMRTIRRGIEAELAAVQTQVQAATEAEKDPNGVQKKLAQYQGMYLAKAATFKTEAVASAAAVAPESDLVFRVRLAMLNGVDARLTQAENGGQLKLLGQLAERMPELAKDEGELNKRLEEAAGQKVNPGADALLKRAKDVSQSVAGKLAYPIERHRLVKAALAAATRSRPEWEAFARGHPEAASKMLVPAVPMTEAEANRKKTFRQDYAPAAVKEVTGLLAAIDPLLSKLQPDKAVQMVGRDELAKTLAEKVQPGWGEYREAYLQYWRDGAKAELKFAAADWAAFRTGMVKLRAGGTQGPLEEFGDRLVEGLKAGGAPGDEIDAISLAAREMKKPDFSNRRDRLVERWSSFSDKGPVARKELLKLKRDDFVLYASEGLGQDFVNAYWKQVQEKGLSLLESVAKQEVAAAEGQLKELQRFPLVRPTDMKEGERDLTPAELTKVRDLIGVWRGVEDVGGGENTLAKEDPPAATPAVSASLAKIRGGEADPRLRKWLDEVSPVLEALPVLADAQGGNGKKMTVTLTWKARDKDGTLMPLERNNMHLRVKQGGTVRPVSMNGDKNRVDDAITFIGDEGELTIELPGEPLTFEFGLFQRGQPEKLDGATRYLGNWPALHMLHRPGTLRLEDGTWRVVVEAPAAAPKPGDRNKLSVTLFMSFDAQKAASKGKQLPPLDKWPKR